MKIVYVKWRDSASYTAWTSHTHPYAISHCESVGFLISRDKKQAVLAGSSSPDCEQYGEVHVIPNENIISFEEIGER